jgi:hypothetical protein
MGFRVEPWLYPGRAKIQFTTSAEMPNLIYQACLTTGVLSNTVYCQLALVDALARDLGVDRQTLLAKLPTPRGPSAHLYDPTGGHSMDRYPHKTRPVSEEQSGGVLSTGPANTNEEVH